MSKKKHPNCENCNKVFISGTTNENFTLVNVPNKDELLNAIDNYLKYEKSSVSRKYPTIDRFKEWVKDGKYENINKEMGELGDE